MITTKIGSIDIRGTEESIMQDWCDLTHVLFKEIFKEDHAEKLRAGIEMLLKESYCLDKMKEK